VTYLNSANLRPWQNEALKAWHAAGRRGIVEVVTGAGKTRLALAAARGWMDDHPMGKVLIIVPTSALQDQWIVSLTEDMGLSLDSIGTWPGNSEPSARVHVLIVNTARNIANKLACGQYVLLIADECHRYATPQNIRAVDLDAVAALGLTATAERQYDDDFYDALVPAIGPIFFKYDLVAARRDGVVTPFNLVNVEISLLDDEAEAYDTATKQLTRAIAADDEDAIKRIRLRRASVVKSARLRVPATVTLLEQLRGLRILIFHEDILSAEIIARLLGERGHSVATYHSQMGTAIRRDNLRNFREGLIDVLVACRALDEGVDIPDAQCAVIASASASRRQRIQRLGRVLRTSKHKQIATVYTIYATDLEKQRLITEQEQLGDVAGVRWMRANMRSDA
jgi:superfamily II DNA or RNA helicase